MRAVGARGIRDRLDDVRHAPAEPLGDLLARHSLVLDRVVEVGGAHENGIVAVPEFAQHVGDGVEVHGVGQVAVPLAGVHLVTPRERGSLIRRDLIAHLHAPIIGTRAAPTV